MKPVNVLYLIRTWALGGSHTILYILLKHLPRDQFNIITVPYLSHSGGDEKFVAEVEKRGFTVAPERIPWQSRTAWFKAQEQVARLIEQYDIGLVHTHDPHSNVLVGLNRKRWRCPCVASPYGWWDRLFPLRSRAYVWVERNWALPRFDEVITVSQTMKDKILRGPTDPERIHVVHTGLDLDAMGTLPSKDDARRKLGVPADVFVVGTVSRIYVEKGHAYLLQAAAKLVESHPELHLLIVGDGPLRPALQAEANVLGISGRVTFTGFCDDLPAAYAAMDVFALPSILEEGFPTVSLEAQAMGLPVVASDLGGTHETIDLGNTGLLVPPRDAEALADAFHQLATDTPRREEMSRAARAWIASRFTLDDMIAGVAAAYEKALGRAGQ